MKRIILILLLMTSVAFASYQIQLRRDTAANWTAVNPTLAQGEIGYETDTSKAKIGDGATAWSGLSYTTFNNESDPCWTASDSYGITDTNLTQWTAAYSHKTTEDLINGLVKCNGSGVYSAVTDNSTNWNTAYGWGDHSVEGYLTSYSETDPCFVASDAYSVTDTNEANWQTAYTHSQIAGGDSVHVSVTENTNWDTAYSHSQDNTQAHSDYLLNSGSDETLGALTATNFVSNIAIGTQPYACTSTTANTNLNADMVDSKHVGTSGNTIPLLDGTNAWSGGNDFGGSSDFEIENGANPTVDTAGEISVDTSVASGSMVRFYGDASYQLPGYYSKSFIVTAPTATADSPLWRCPWAITIRAVHLLCIGGTNVVGQLDEYDGNGANPAVVDSNDITSAAGTNANDDGALSNSSVDAGDYVGWHTTSVSGDVTRMILSFEYTVDAAN